MALFSSKLPCPFFAHDFCSYPIPLPFPIRHAYPSLHNAPLRITPSHSPFRRRLPVFASTDFADIASREAGMPVPGTITFRRSASQKHYEYLTDLEKLGMEGFSSQLSRSMALSMGIPDSGNSTTTPVSVSIDVSKEGRDLRLDGIVRTSMALHCSRCGIPVSERVFGEFSLLLTEKPVVEPTKARLGVVLGDEQIMPDEEADLEEILDLELDDKLYFPKTEKSIDISKYIRDTVHLEIPLQCLCVLSCKGKCINCGVNLNHGACECDIDAYKRGRRAVWDQLGELRKQLDNDVEFS